MSNGSIEKIYNKAIKLLEPRPHSVWELKRKLTTKGYDKAGVDEVLNKLLEQDYLNDQRFASIFLDNLIKYKTFGYYGLKAKLLQRGINQDLISELLADFSLEDEKRVALRLLAKKREKDPVKLARSLASKGFRTEVIKIVLKDRDAEFLGL